jgi:hypothetical protein
MWTEVGVTAYYALGSGSEPDLAPFTLRPLPAGRGETVVGAMDQDTPVGPMVSPPQG